MITVITVAKPPGPGVQTARAAGFGGRPPPRAGGAMPAVALVVYGFGVLVFGLRFRDFRDQGPGSSLPFRRFGSWTKEIKPCCRVGKNLGD